MHRILSQYPAGAVIGTHVPFKAMNEETGVDLENIVYYKDEVDSLS